MAPPSPTQLAWRGRIETMIRLAQPALDLVLAAGERVSRIVEPEDLDWTPPRSVSAPTAPPQVGAGPARRSPR
ncbi:MAG: hypothetical protein QOF12_1276 [Solirubrobacteraceae bacterium]|nr:hypothetical protein [Solirubrobacteraceae bacterium]